MARRKRTLGPSRPDPAVTIESFDATTRLRWLAVYCHVGLRPVDPPQPELRDRFDEKADELREDTRLSDEQRFQRLYGWLADQSESELARVDARLRQIAESHASYQMRTAERSSH